MRAVLDHGHCGIRLSASDGIAGDGLLHPVNLPPGAMVLETPWGCQDRPGAAGAPIRRPRRHDLVAFLARWHTAAVMAKRILAFVVSSLAWLAYIWPGVERPAISR